MNMNKFIGYIAAIIIGAGFILMAISDTLHSSVASVLQAFLGIIFIVFGTKKEIEELKREN